MRLQLHVSCGSIYGAGPKDPAFEHQTKHYLVDDQGVPTSWYFQIFEVRDRFGIEDRVLLLLKNGKTTVKKSTVRVDIDGVLTLDTDTDEPIDPVSDAYATLRVKLPQLQSWDWKLHREPGLVATDPVSPGIRILHDAGAEATVDPTTVWDQGDDYPAEYVSISSARWVAVCRDGRVSKVHLWPGASEQIEEIVEALRPLLTP